MPRELRLSRRQVAASVFAALAAIYIGLGSTNPDNDTITSVCLPQRILKDGTFAFTREDSPYLFLWSLKTPRGQESVYFRDWNQTVGGKSGQRTIGGCGRSRRASRSRSPRVFGMAEGPSRGIQTGFSRGRDTRMRKSRPRIRRAENPSSIWPHGRNRYGAGEPAG